MHNLCGLTIWCAANAPRKNLLNDFHVFKRRAHLKT